jgi:hypothetical protein
VVALRALRRLEGSSDLDGGLTEIVRQT